MKKFLVNIIFGGSTGIFVEAENEDEAREKVDQMIDNEEIMLPFEIVDVDIMEIRGGEAMKFEEVLPKMRDEEQVGVCNGTRYRFENGQLMFGGFNGWRPSPVGNALLTSDAWELEPKIVKKWKWAFGFGKKVQLVNKNFMTEAEAEKYKDEYHFGWAERIMRTVTEEES